MNTSELYDHKETSHQHRLTVHRINTNVKELHYVKDEAFCRAQLPTSYVNHYKYFFLNYIYVVWDNKVFIKHIYIGPCIIVIVEE